MKFTKKALTLLILEILKKYSDSENFLTQQEIIDFLERDYGLEVERKSVSNSLNILIDLGYDVVKQDKKGYALIERDFDNSEITFLIDAIFSSKSLSAKNAKSLAQKITKNLSFRDKEFYKYLYKSDGVNRTNNNDIFLNIEIISEAIKRKKWIEFKYLDYDINANLIEKYNGYVYHASPCYLVNNFGNYYLLGFRNKYNTVNAYRIDYMKDVKVMEERDRLEPLELKEFSKYKSLSEFMNDHIYLFDGNSIDCHLKLKGPYALKYIYDWFGKNVRIKTKNDTIFAEIRCNENALFFWLMQYSEHIEIISPKSLIERVVKAADNITNKYKK